MRGSLYMTDFSQQKARLKEVLSKAERENILAQNEVSQLVQRIKGLETEQSILKHKVELYRMAITILQQLVDAVAVQNIKRTENLVNTALGSIFKDQNVQFRIDQDIKRNQVLYKIVISQDGVEGGLHSFGGGIFAVVAIILKALIIILAKRYPVLILDESLVFVSEQYISQVSSFLRDLTKPLPEGLGLPILLVSHQEGFNEGADQIIEATPGIGGVKLTHKGPR